MSRSTVEHITMKVKQFSSYILFVLLFHSIFHQLVYCQQAYLNTTGLDCYKNPSASKGYLCDGHIKSCKTFVTFNSRAPYDTTTNIAYLLGSEASEIASLNNISSSTSKIPTNKLIIVPISCTCSGNIFQHLTPYTVKKPDTYFKTANETYQGLTTCQALIGQNYYDSENIPIGAELTVPVRCACPSDNQTASDVMSLLVYIVHMNDSLASIGERFGVNTQSMLEANMLLQDSIIYPFTPMLVPLKSQSCSVNPGLFFCSCHNGSGGLNCKSNDNKRSFPVKLVTILGVCIGIGLLVLFLLSYKLYRWLKRRRIKIQKEEFFKLNGGFLLQEKLPSYGSSAKAKLFTAEELQRATDNYNNSRFLGQGGNGTVYKGMLLDGTIVAVKRSKAIDREQIEQFINEVIILSQTNHRNIVRLLGFCLETDAPLLVYEFISNGTLSHHIKKKDLESSLTWEARLSIACDVAGALAYMHSAASMPIFHRDIKPSNVLLDEKYNAKISDFGTSRSVPYDKTHLTTAVQGTFGYMDPEYFYSSQYTDKSDVYSFGIILVELLTGENPFTFAKDEGKNLVASFISLFKENQLSQILDPQVAKQAGKDNTIESFAELAAQCLKLNGKKRPAMKQVSMELEGFRRSQGCLPIDQHTQLFRGHLLDMHLTSNKIEELVEEQSIGFSLDLESASFH